MPCLQDPDRGPTSSPTDEGHLPVLRPDLAAQRIPRAWRMTCKVAHKGPDPQPCPTPPCSWRWTSSCRPGVSPTARGRSLAPEAEGQAKPRSVAAVFRGKGFVRRLCAGGRSHPGCSLGWNSILPLQAGPPRPPLALHLFSLSRIRHFAAPSGADCRTMSSAPSRSNRVRSISMAASQALAWSGRR